MHGDQTTYQTIENAHNNSITWGKHLGKIMVRSSNCQDCSHDPHHMTPTNVGPLCPNSMLVVLTDEVPPLPRQENRVE